MFVLCRATGQVSEQCKREGKSEPLSGPVLSSAWRQRGEKAWLKNLERRKKIQNSNCSLCFRANVPVFMHQGSCWPCACQQTPGCSTTAKEHSPAPSLFRSPLWQPDFCHMQISDMLLVLYKTTNPIKSHTSVLAPVFDPQRQEQRAPLLCHCLWRYCPLHTTPRGYPAIKQEGKTIIMHKAQPFPWKPSTGYPVENCSWVRYPSTDLLGSW